MPVFPLKKLLSDFIEYFYRWQVGLNTLPILMVFRNSRQQQRMYTDPILVYFGINFAHKNCFMFKILLLQFHIN